MAYTVVALPAGAEAYVVSVVTEVRVVVDTLPFEPGAVIVIVEVGAPETGPTGLQLPVA